jgi:hypothetical protein
MSEQAKPSSGGNDGSASGAAGDQSQDQQSVAYETHKKLLAEKKKRDEELATLKSQLEQVQAKERERQESELKAKEEWKKLVEIREKELSELKKQVEQKDSLIVTSIKRGAVKSAINGMVPDKYLGLIDVSKVVINPETGEPDPASVQEVARSFEQEHKLLILSKDGKTGLPHEAAAGAKKLTYQEWVALPNSKEMKARQNEVDWSTAP